MSIVYIQFNNRELYSLQSRQVLTRLLQLTVYYLNKKHPFVFRKLRTKSEAVKTIHLLQTY